MVSMMILAIDVALLYAGLLCYAPFRLVCRFSSFLSLFIFLFHCFEMVWEFEGEFFIVRKINKNVKTNVKNNAG